METIGPPRARADPAARRAPAREEGFAEIWRKPLGPPHPPILVRGVVEVAYQEVIGAGIAPPSPEGLA